MSHQYDYCVLDLYLMFANFENQIHSFEKGVLAAKEQINAILAGERTPEPGAHLQAATYIAARSQSTSPAAQSAEPVSRKERAHYHQQVKPLEESDLTLWAKTKALWIDNEDFNKTYAQRYVDAGAEQKVYLNQNGKRVRKVNTGAFHGTWLEFFIRLIVHKAIFPSTAYSLTGFTEAENEFCAVIEQPWVRVERGASKEEVQTYLAQLGFINSRYNDYYHAAHGIILEDLHDENVFIGPAGNLLFVDPVIYLETPDMNLAGKSLFRFPFATAF